MLVARVYSQSAAAQLVMRGNFGRRRRVIITAFVLTSITCVVLLSRLAFSGLTLEGRLRPHVRAISLDGSSVVLSAPYGRPLALVFFLVHCPHCLRELGHLCRIVPLIPSADVVAISLSSASETRHLVDSLRPPFPVVCMRAEDAGRTFGVFRVPTIFMVDARDVIRRVRSGAQRFAEDSVTFVRFSRGEGVFGVQ